MQIVSIKKDKLHLTKVCLSDGQEVLLDNEVCCCHCLKVGCSLDEESLKKLSFESEYVRAKSRAIWYMDRCDHTEKSLYQKLLRAGFKKEPCAKVIARLREVGILDDHRFAENYAQRLTSTNVSKREMVGKMLQKGVPYDLVKEVLDETEIDEQSQIKNLLQKKYRTKLQTENGPQKVYAALVRKGFSYGAVKTALKVYIEEFEE